MTKPRPRILIVTRNLPPLVGGMERLNWHMAQELSRCADVKIVGPAGASSLAPSVVAIEEIPLTPLWCFLVCAHFATLWCALRWRPDVIIAGSGLTALPVKIASQFTGARSVAYVHGLDITVQHWVYRRLWLPALMSMHRVVVNSRATEILARSNGIDGSRIGIVHPGVDLGISTCELATTERFREKHQLRNRVVLLSLGRLSERKGLREFVAKCLPQVASRWPSVILLIAGAEPNNALHASTQSPQSIMDTAQAYAVEKHIRFIGAIDDDDASAAFEVADVHVFPVRELPNDPEGFGMVAIEAAVHGIPTVAFATGGVSDAVDDGKSGFLVPSGDYELMANRITTAIENKSLLQASAREFAQHFSWSRFGENIMREIFDR